METSEPREAQEDEEESVVREEAVVELDRRLVFEEVPPLERRSPVVRRDEGAVHEGPSVEDLPRLDSGDRGARDHVEGQTEEQELGENIDFAVELQLRLGRLDSYPRESRVQVRGEGGFLQKNEGVVEDGRVESEGHSVVGH